MKRSLTFATAASLITAGVGMSHTAEAAIKQEKCYGIAKAGKNDCAAADGAHACAGYSKKDASDVDWILLPHGVCERIIEAELEPTLDLSGN